MWKWIVHNTLKSAFGAISRITLLNYYLRLKASKELRSPVYKKLLQGSKPLYTGDEGRINILRPDLDKQISTFCSPKLANSGTFTRFGVVIGTSGCGKTCSMMKFCHEHPSGVLSFETTSAKAFTEELAKETGDENSSKNYVGFDVGVHT